MTRPPTLRTERLVLRPFRRSDAADLCRLLQTPEVTDGLLGVSQPYTLQTAEEWIRVREDRFASGQEARFAIVGGKGGGLYGALGLWIEERHRRAELGYWLGRPYWGQGYCTEAVREVLRYAFTTRGLHRVWASHFPRNTASGRVLQKIGMRQEGCLRGHGRKGDRYEDLVVYGILDAEWQAADGC